MILTRLALFTLLLLMPIAMIGYAHHDPVPMPKEFLGYWKPSSSTTANVGLEIKSNGTFRYLFNDKNRKPLDYGEYRILKIEDNCVFVLIHKEVGEYYKKREPQEIFLPRYYYAVLKYEKKYNTLDIIHTTRDDDLDDLTVVDWSLPLSTHLKRINTIHDFKNQWSSYTYSRD